MKNWIVLIFLFALYSCNPVQTELTAKNPFNSSTGAATGSQYKAYTLDINPAAKLGKDRVSPGMSLNQFLSSGITTLPSYLTNLDGRCSIVYNTFRSSISATEEKCFSIFKTNGTQEDFSSGIFTFFPSDERFYEVNTYVLADRTFNLYKNIISKVASTFHRTSFTHPSAFPFVLNPVMDYESSAEVFEPKTLKVTPVCDFKNNGFFDPVQFEVCLGYLSDYPGVLFAQDPSVVYHELGHYFVDTFINARNRKMPAKVSLGSLAYDEAGAINEGIADYFAYAITGRKHVGEWALGFIGADRPLTESSPDHSSLVQNSSLSYPEYINYNVFDTKNPYEAVHFTGQIASHFLTAFDSMLTSSCSMSAENARVMTLSLIAETLAHIGDLTARDNDFNDQEFSEDQLDFDNDALGDPFGYYNNLDPNNSFLFSMVVNPPNFRRFFQVFSRNVLHHIISYSCLNRVTKDQYEQLLDRYGLLLFKTYNDNLNQVVDGEDVDYTAIESIADLLNDQRAEVGLDILNEVNEINRQNTILISKDKLALPATNDTRPQAYVFDKRSDVEKVITGMTFAGQAVSISTGIAGFEYNNNNGYISPGEVVGLSLNLVNNSNTVAAGVHVLANDWDHLKVSTDDETGETTVKPCQFNGWPLASENGAEDLDPSDPQPGDCHYASRDNGKGDDPTDYAAPICLVQLRTSNETKWITQDEFKDELGLFPWKCLNNEGHSESAYYDENGEQCADEDIESCTLTTSYNANNECFIRTLSATQHAFMSNIKPQKTLIESLTRDDGKQVALNASSAIFFEVSKFTPPGTTFMCRFRVRMNNCSDCFENPETKDDYQDYEFNGPKPYQIINYKFTVID